MSNLYAIRHGQASFFAEDYDQLSLIGETQARLLGEYWARRRVIFDEVYTGPRRRHVDTARLVGNAYREAGLPWPEPVMLPGLDEYEAEAVLKQALPQLVAEHEPIRRLHEAVERATDRAAKLRAFQKMYEVVIDRWVHGQLNLPQVESWDAFCQRMHESLDRIAANPAGGRQVAAFTSGGPVGICMQRALGLTHRTTLQMAWMVRNAAFSEFIFSGERFTLSRYNAFPHLDDPEHLTYR
ncbi:MAG TPA: histidine phosphatase family protein [Pirellulales bacterium]|nr:histidine phosphatase family protein [Pirellulales bacterium]